MLYATFASMQMLMVACACTVNTLQLDINDQQPLYWGVGSEIFF